MQKKNKSEEQIAFMQRAEQCILHHLDDAEFDRDTFAREMLVSSSTLYNKVHEFSGMSVSSYVASVRMKAAVRMCEKQPDMKMTEASLLVGFNSPKYFSKCFKKSYGMLFNDYIHKDRMNHSM